MRDPERIPEILELLWRAWEREPDYRLGQLLVVALRPNRPSPEVFHAEDTVWEARLRALLEAGTSAPPEFTPDPEAVRWWEGYEPAPPASVRLLGSREGRIEQHGLTAWVLELRFGGEYGSGSAGNPDAAFMGDMVSLAIGSCPWVDGVLLDLSELVYDWGDAIERVFDAVTRRDERLPVACVILGGPRSAPALSSLLGCPVRQDRDGALAEMLQLSLRRAWSRG